MELWRYLCVAVFKKLKKSGYRNAPQMVASRISSGAGINGKEKALQMRQKPEKKNFAWMRWLSAAMLVLGIAVAGLTGCGQSCKSLDNELESYIKGEFQNVDKLKAAEKCQTAMKKCPDLPSSYEAMGDLKAQENRPKEALAHYQKALGLSSSKERIQDKINQIETSLEEKAAKDAVEGKEMAIKRVGGTRMGEYANVDESLRLAWCEYMIEKKKESLEERRRKSSTLSTFNLNVSASDLDQYLIKMIGRLEPNAQAYDCVLYILENAVNQEVPLKY